ncbi:periplasmic nitrate reductase, NapE protein [Endozoicomonas elysicola]|uniref:periplasmic nitrate reductase, NapE protein n=1 Tax=Endozoicomonas elysicola TaxID=305900 RepID=UPI0003A5AA80|nr:periplasmic nitrate reductase, NapE protein [Endozoicomonas elysicola]
MNDSSVSRRQEYKALALVIVVFFPLLTIMLISSYGFLVWFSQLLLGPPGHG